MDDWECANDRISEYTLGDKTTEYYYPFDGNWRDERRDLTFSDECRYSNSLIDECQPNYYAAIIVPVILYFVHIIAIFITGVCCCRNP